MKIYITPYFLVETGKFQDNEWNEIDADSLDTSIHTIAMMLTM